MQWLRFSEAFLLYYPMAKVSRGIFSVLPCSCYGILSQKKSMISLLLHKSSTQVYVVFANFLFAMWKLKIWSLWKDCFMSAALQSGFFRQMNNSNTDGYVIKSTDGGSVMATIDEHHWPRFGLCVWHRTPKLHLPPRTFLLASALPGVPCCVWRAVGVFGKRDETVCFHYGSVYMLQWPVWPCCFAHNTLCHQRKANACLRNAGSNCRAQSWAQNY